MNIKKGLKLFAFAAMIMGTNACDEAFVEPFDIENGGSLGANVEPPSSLAYLRGQTSVLDFNVNLVENASAPVSDIQASIVLTVGAEKSSIYEVTVPASGAVNISSSDLFQNTPVNGTVQSESTLNAGDSWSFSYVINLADGRKITPSRTTTVTFTCPSDLAGTYTNNTEVSVSDFGAQSYTTEEELTEIGDGQYSVPDMTGGLWSLDPYAGAYGTSARTTTLTEICSSITVADAPDQFGGFITTAGRPAPTFNEATGVIQWSWIDTIYGETGVTTYTPKN